MKSWGCKKHSCLMSNGPSWNRFCPRQKAAAAPGPIIAGCSKAFSGCSRPAHAGGTCPRNIPAPAPAGGACANGKKMRCGSKSGGNSSVTWTSGASWIGANRFWTPVSLRLKKGLRSWQNQARQGHKVDGGGRRPRCSSGKPTGLGQPGGSDAGGEHAGADCRTPRAGRGRPQQRPLRVIADRGYDSDPLRWRLLQRGILLICPHRRGRRKPSLNDGRTLRRYRNRWKIERTFARLGNYRRLLVRYDHQITMARAFFHLACLIITLRYL